MPDIVLCTQADAADWISETGLRSRMDDDLGQDYDASESAIADRLIARASGVVAVHLATRYTTVDFAGTNPPTNTPPFVRHCAAIVYTFFSCGRRMCPVSKSLQAEYERVLEYLKEIQLGRLQLPDIADSYETLPFMTNLTIAGASHGVKVRALPAISSGSPPPGESKRKNYTLSNLDQFPFTF